MDIGALWSTEAGKSSSESTMGYSARINQAILTGMRASVRLAKLVALASTVGCGTASPPSSEPRSSPPVVLAAAPIPDQAEQAEPARAVAEVVPPPALPPTPAFDAPALPSAFFDLRADLEKLFPEKAQLIAADAATLAPQPSPGASTRRPMLWDVPVIEARDPDYRLACSTRSLRIALYVPADALATVIRKLTFLLPVPFAAQAPRERPETGLFLAAGARVSLPTWAAASSQQVLVRYQGLFLTAEGFAEASAIGKTYTKGALPDDPIVDGELTANVNILDAPGGVAFARVAKEVNVANTLLVHILGPAKNGYRPIRYQEKNAAVVGWVEAASVMIIPRVTGSGGGGSGWGLAGPKNPVKLPAGTRLRAPTAPSDSALGVLLEEQELECTGDCASDAPTVRAYACGTTVEVVAVRDAGTAAAKQP